VSQPSWGGCRLFAGVPGGTGESRVAIRVFQALDAAVALRPAEPGSAIRVHRAFDAGMVTYGRCRRTLVIGHALDAIHQVGIAIASVAAACWVVDHAARCHAAPQILIANSGTVALEVREARDAQQRVRTAVLLRAVVRAVGIAAAAR